MSHVISLIIKILKIYSIYISPFILPRCRFYPTCSKYSIDALKKFGIKGIWIALKRLIKCHPFNKGGIDHINTKNYNNFREY